MLEFSWMGILYDTAIIIVLFGLIFGINKISSRVKYKWVKVLLLIIKIALITIFLVLYLYGLLIALIVMSGGLQ